MAKPIQSTPVIKGKDAKRFLSDIDSKKPISSEEKAKQKQIYESFMSIAEFSW